MDYEYHQDMTGSYPQYAMDHSVDFHVKEQRLVSKGYKDVTVHNTPIQSMGEG